MTKQRILEVFKDINDAYNDSSRFDTLSRMIDDLLQEQKVKYLKGIVDNQLAYTESDPCPYDNGFYDGMELAWHIVAEDT